MSVENRLSKSTSRSRCLWRNSSVNSLDDNSHRLIWIASLDASRYCVTSRPPFEMTSSGPIKMHSIIDSQRVYERIITVSADDLAVHGAKTSATEVPTKVGYCNLSFACIWIVNVGQSRKCVDCRVYVISPYATQWALLECYQFVLFVVFPPQKANNADLWFFVCCWPQ